MRRMIAPVLLVAVFGMPTPLTRIHAQSAAARRQALLLATVEGQPYVQIARRAGVSVGAIKSRVRRGREMLKRLPDPQVVPHRDASPKHTPRRTSQCLPS
jgi:DNA-binding NarL/FixJ family response regulator